MSGGPPTRGLFRNIFKAIQKSLFVAQESKGSLIGSDPFGNKYYEVPADPR